MLRVCFNCYGNYTTDSVYQWDLNHTLQITGLTTEQPPTVHFCNKKSDTAIVVQSEMSDGVITVPIPNQFLEEPYNIIAYVHIYDDNNAKTIEVVNIPLTKRPKPDDYQFTENIDIMNFERLEKDFADFTDLIEGEFEQLENDMSDYKSNIDDMIEEMERDLLTVDGKKANNNGVGYTYIRPRRDTASAWTTANPVLAEGEIGIEVPSTGVGSGIVKIKFGDGVTAWKNLPYGLELDTLENDFNNLLLSAGINSNLLGDNLIPTKITFADLIAKTTVTFFTNTTDNTNFPFTYGSGVMIPHADSRYRFILYFSKTYIFKGYVTVATSEVNWIRVANLDELTNYLPLTGGTLTGGLVATKGLINHSWKSNENAQGYLKIATIVIPASYMDSPIEFDVITRNADRSTRVSLLFNGGSGNDPSLKSLTKVGPHNVYIHKSATSTWDIYVQTKTVYEMVVLSNLTYGCQFVDKANTFITYSNSYVASLPTGYTEATLANVDMISNYTNAIKRTVLGATNIDELLTPGFYGKGNCTGITGTLPTGWGGDAFDLDVESCYGNAERIRQTIKGVFIGKIATRIYTGTWGPWKYIPYDLSTILWQNASVAGLSEQTIAVDLTKIVAIEVQYIEKYYANPGTYGLVKATTGKIELSTTANESICLKRFDPDANFGPGGNRRIFIDRTNNQIIIRNGYEYSTSLANSESVSICVPTKIIGYTG